MFFGSQFEFFLNYQQHKVGIPVNQFFPFVSLCYIYHGHSHVKCKMLINLLFHYYALKELIPRDKYKKIKLSETKMPDLSTFQSLSNLSQWRQPKFKTQFCIRSLPLFHEDIRNRVFFI